MRLSTSIFLFIQALKRGRRNCQGFSQKCQSPTTIRQMMNRRPKSVRIHHHHLNDEMNSSSPVSSRFSTPFLGYLFLALSPLSKMLVLLSLIGKIFSFPMSENSSIQFEQRKYRVSHKFYTTRMKLRHKMYNAF